MYVVAKHSWSVGKDLEDRGPPLENSPQSTHLPTIPTPYPPLPPTTPHVWAIHFPHQTGLLILVSLCPTEGSLVSSLVVSGVSLKSPVPLGPDLPAPILHFSLLMNPSASGLIRQLDGRVHCTLSPSPMGKLKSFYHLGHSQTCRAGQEEKT